MTSVGTPPARLVVVPVGSLDRRAAEAVAYAWSVPAADRRALHVVTDEDAANDLARAWLAREIAFPLFFAEDDGGIPRTVARVIALELDGGYDEVLVVAGQLALRRRVHRLLHDRTAAAIGRAAGAIPAVSVGLLTVGPA